MIDTNFIAGASVTVILTAMFYIGFMLGFRVGKLSHD